MRVHDPCDSNIKGGQGSPIKKKKDIIESQHFTSAPKMQSRDIAGLPKINESNQIN